MGHDKEWYKDIIACVWSAPQYLRKRPETFPTLGTLQPKSANDWQVVELLAKEYHKTQKIHDLLKKIMDIYENGRFAKKARVSSKSKKVSECIADIFYIWCDLKKKFP